MGDVDVPPRPELGLGSPPPLPPPADPPDAVLPPPEVLKISTSCPRSQDMELRGGSPAPAPAPPAPAFALFPDKKSSQFESPPADDGAPLDVVETKSTCQTFRQDVGMKDTLAAPEEAGPEGAAAPAPAAAAAAELELWMGHSIPKGWLCETACRWPPSESS